jgi:CRISPR-associated endonuclease Csn1
MKNILGLDLGSSSIGWALRDEQNNIKTGVVTFDSGMVKGTSGYTSPTKDRREARSKRRLLQARKYRKWALLKVLGENYSPLHERELEKWSKYRKGEPQIFPESDTFLKWLKCDFSYLGVTTEYKNPYELRVKALSERLHPHEFGRALYHLVQRRGYKNIGESDIDELNIEEANKDKETKKQLERRESEGFAQALENSRTIAEALKNEFLDKGKRARNQYPLRREYRNEFEQLCNAQGFDIARDELGSYNNSFVHQLWKAIIWQRPLRSQKGNIGRCTLENDKPRCPISHPLFEIFRAWQFINTIKTIRKENDESIKEDLPKEVKDKLYYDFFLKKDKNVNFSEIKKFLDKQSKKENQYNYKGDHSISTMPVCRGLIDVFGKPIIEQIKVLHHYNIGNAPKIINEKYSVFDLWHALYSFDKSYLKQFSVQKLGIPDQQIKKGKSYNPFSKLKDKVGSSFSDLSVKAISKIIPFLQEGFIYNEAVLLAKVPESLSGEWKQRKEDIYAALKAANEGYNFQKTITSITNSLIDNWKGLQHGEKFAYKDVSYVLQPDDITDIIKACHKHFGETSWQSKNSEFKNKIINGVTLQYQGFFSDSKRAYRNVFSLEKIFNDELRKIGIHLNLALYHHSKHENPYLKRIGTKPDGTPKLPIDKKSGKEILPIPLIDSIKNPMFNKALCILRKLLNEFIRNGDIDNQTEIVIEVARELNDNNKRLAIERYQRERENQREMYKKFLEEFKEKENVPINVDENISTFELWTEQTFDETRDEKSQIVKNKNRTEILKEKDSVKRYELWMEQKGQCMYTGKMISIEQLFSNKIDVEHTIPRSILPDNTLANQTVCYALYNRDKKKKQFPVNCDNYEKDVEGWGTAIKPRLKYWEEIRNHYEREYEKHTKPNPGEDEEGKNSRIQKKHYYKMHLEYWKDKLERFECTEIKEGRVRRQLTDTQMISKYAIEFLSIYFKKVKVQKGSVTAAFRKIFSIQEEDEIKNRNKHTHHAIDSAVLTLIPTNSSYRERLLKTMYEWQEQKRGQYTITPFTNYNSQELIRNIENSVLVVNYEKDKILKRTYKIIRNRGRVIYLPKSIKLPESLKDNPQLNTIKERAKKIPKIACGDSVRTTLYKQTFVAKLRDVERENGKPLRNKDGSWKFKTGPNEFFFAERVSIEDAKKYIVDIVDPAIKKLLSEQKNNSIVKDHQGNNIRHVRVKTNAGKIVKKRLNYQSKHDYKNQYYAASGDLPYAGFLQRLSDGKIERLLIPISSAELAKMYKTHGRFNIEKFIEINYPDYINYPDIKLLKVGQKVFVLNNDDEYEKRNDVIFQTKRLYVIRKFDYLGRKIILNYHLESRELGEIDKSIKETKSDLLKQEEKKYSIPEIKPNESISNAADRKKEYEKRLYDFRARIEKIKDHSCDDSAKILLEKIETFKTESSAINDNNPVPILGLSRNNWNFLLEGDDFEISLSGKLTFL